MCLRYALLAWVYCFSIGGSVDGLPAINESLCDTTPRQQNYRILLPNGAKRGKPRVSASENVGDEETEPKSASHDGCGATEASFWSQLHLNERNTSSSCNWRRQCETNDARLVAVMITGKLRFKSIDGVKFVLNHTEGYRKFYVSYTCLNR